MFEIKVRLGGGAKTLSRWTWEDRNWLSWGHPEEDMPRMLKEAFGRHATLWSFLPPHRCQIARVFCFPSFQCHSKDETKFRDFFFVKIYSTDLIKLEFLTMKAGTGSGKTACREKVGKAGESWAANSWSANLLELKSGSSTKLEMLNSHRIALVENKEQLVALLLWFFCGVFRPSSSHVDNLLRLPHVTRLNSKGKPGKVPILTDHDSDCGFSVLAKTQSFVSSARLCHSKLIQTYWKVWTSNHAECLHRWTQATLVPRMRCDLSGLRVVRWVFTVFAILWNGMTRSKLTWVS